MQPPESLPLPLRTDDNAFANHTMRVRIPFILRETQRLNPDYPPTVKDRLERLAADLEADAPIPPLSLPAPDWDAWMAAYHSHQGETWQRSVWWFAEVYLYRCVMEAVRWFETARDPFLPKKREELGSASLWDALESVLEIGERAADEGERLAALLLFDLWGNRIDLSHQAAGRGIHGRDDDLLVDDRDIAIEQLLQRDGAVHIVADNAGSELAMDFALIDALLNMGHETVTLHLKWHPTFVSDATAGDALEFIHLLEGQARRAAVRALGGRLRAAFDAGRVRFAPDAFWNSTGFFWQIPERLERVFADAALVIVKGDANYRRLIGDALWPATTPFGTVLSYFPAPLLALRTLKSDAVVGLPEGMEAALDRRDLRWRVDGQYGLIQFKR